MVLSLDVCVCSARRSRAEWTGRSQYPTRLHRLPAQQNRLQRRYDCALIIIFDVHVPGGEASSFDVLNHTLNANKFKRPVDTRMTSFVVFMAVVKFKRRARYLEFFVQCAEKALTEGIAPTALEWCVDTEQWLFK